MENETKQQNNNGLNPILTLFIFGFGLCSAFYLFDWIKESEFINFDFENKNYIPYTYENKLILINQKNGKTYILNQIQTKEGFAYIYSFVGKPKKKKVKFFEKNDPLELFSNRKDGEQRRNEYDWS